MFSTDEFKKRIDAFPQRYIDNFEYVWKWKVAVETDGSAHVLDKDHRKEAYSRLCKILPKWQTYRMGDNSEPLKTLKESLDNISEAYNHLRKFTLLDFENIPPEILETVWHELGRAKEKDGNKNAQGRYFIIAVTKPLLLAWGQTLAFDSKVRKHTPKNYNIPKYACKWTLNQWTKAMKQFSTNLNFNPKFMDTIKKESEKRYGKEATVPYGRFLDIYYWQGPCQ